jgi:hypothetical protein
MNYIKYDTIGVKTIYCMNCGTPIVERSYVNLLINSIPPRQEKVMVLKKLNSFRRKKLDVEGGAYIEAMVCSDCVNLKLDPDKIERAIRDGWKATWHQEGKDKKEIKQLKKDLPKLERKK